MHPTATELGARNLKLTARRPQKKRNYFVQFYFTKNDDLQVKKEGTQAEYRQYRRRDRGNRHQKAIKNW
jgi:hypothetical protein